MSVLRLPRSGDSLQAAGFAARRFQRPVALQAMPDTGLPAELQDANPLGLVRLVNGQLTSARIDRLVTS